MTHEQINHLVKNQRDFFLSGRSRDISFREKTLKHFEIVIKESEADILSALKADLGKPPFEAYASEIGLILKELRFVRRNLKSWSRRRRVPATFSTLFSKNYIHPEPYGHVLIISPWNYPFQLAISPLIGAVAAGNCVILKPSQHAPNTARVISEIISKSFDKDHVSTITGPNAHAVLEQRFDYIFFTGGTEVGKLVMSAAAKHLTPVTLELGGKSPCIVDKDVSLDIAAKRIVWGKFWNAGQTCIAPDYLMVHSSIKTELIEKLQLYIKKFFGENPAVSKDFARIINEKHFDRLVGLMSEGRIITGGESNKEEKYISPTIIDNIDLHKKIMKEEIFGPLLPVLPFNDLEEAIAAVKKLPKPLALYLFSGSKKNQEKIIAEIPYGGGAINDTLVHFSNCKLPFGGVGDSGIGRYHGRYSFDTFSHFKSVTKSPCWFDALPKYPPYKQNLGLLKRLLRL